MRSIIEMKNIFLHTLFLLGGMCLFIGSSSGNYDGNECLLSEHGPDYYTIDLVSTRRVSGSGQAVGIGEVYYAPTPFGISLAEDGSYIYNLDIQVEKLRPPKKGVYVAWITTPQIDQVKRIGVLNEANHVSGTVKWNKFLVVITLEPDATSVKDEWTGPVVLRGLSRSGLMHTMAGHGPFEDEPCALYGY